MGIASKLIFKLINYLLMILSRYEVELIPFITFKYNVGDGELVFIFCILGRLIRTLILIASYRIGLLKIIVVRKYFIEVNFILSISGRS